MPIIFEPGHLYYRYSTAIYSCNCQIHHLWFFLLTGPYMPVLSSSVMAFTTYHIVKKLRKVRRLGETQQQNKLRLEKNMKAAKVIVTSAIFFTLAYYPFIVLTFVDFLSDKSIKHPPIVDFVCTWVANVNSFVNIIIYACIYSSFRKAIKKTILKCFTCNVCQEKPENIPESFSSIKTIETVIIFNEKSKEHECQEISPATDRNQ